VEGATMIDLALVLATVELFGLSWACAHFCKEL
jgi:hypothetical protein